MRLETLGAMAALAAAVLTVEQRGNASTFGLVLSYALSITMLTSMTVSLLPLASPALQRFALSWYVGLCTVLGCTMPARIMSPIKHQLSS